ncbi:MAG: hypothetical protein Q9210_000212 [Variospora velana]
MTVSDGTWDTTRNTFLLPNLVGLNFATMRYNGMGNRFREFNGYHNLILAHGVMAALTFLLFVPSAIMLMRFKKHRPNAVRFHVWLQILTFLLGTAIIILGFVAVGPERGLSNPHHGIGLALYVMIVFQFFGGAWIRHKEKKKRPSYGLLRILLHHWLGRAIALLGIAQVALGLTLYGSPKALFVLYALAVFFLIFAYFVLTYRDDKHGRSDYDDRYSYSYGSGSVVEDRRRHSGGISNLVKAGAAGAGIAALASRFRNRSRSRSGSRHRAEPEVVGSRRHSMDDTVDEKYSQYGRDRGREGGWKDRLLKVGAVAGAAGLASRYFGRRRDHDRDSDIGEYGPPLGGATAINPDPIERIEEGRPIPSNQHPLNQPLGHRRSTSSMSYSSYTSASQEGRSHGLRNAVAGLGAFGLARNIFKGRRERKEQKRLDDARREQERRDRTNNRRLTGDGFPRRNGRRGSLTTSTMTDSTNGRPHHDPGLPLPIPAGTFPIGAGTAGAGVAGHDHNRMRPGPPPLAPPPLAPPLPANIPPPPRGPVTQPVSMPPIPPDPQGGLFHPESSASSADGRHRRRRRSGRHNAAATAAGAGSGEASSSRRDRHHSTGIGEGSPASPPVSVKVKMHSDGRHVTLRRLPEEEAAAERAARRRSRDPHGRHGDDSASFLSGAGSGADRWRRTEALERQQAEQMRVESERLAAARSQAQNAPSPPPVPPPPPIPGSSTGPPPRTGSVSSPGNYETEGSAGDYANNRRRRRAERAQARQAQRAAGANGVDFT